jgi:hypothetical protein
MAKPEAWPKKSSHQMPWLSVIEALTGSFPTSVESVNTTALTDQSAQRRKGDTAARSTECAPPLIT